MSERKVINKYIPPDFDPDLIQPRAGGLSLKALGITSKKPGKTVRIMLPFSIRCSTCLDYIYKGKKFNARKETCREKYLDRVDIYRFYIKCPTCYSEITYKTDPENADYAAEHGCTRNYEPWREEAKETKAMRIKREFEAKFEPLKAVESKAIDSKRELEMTEALEELQSAKTKIEIANANSIYGGSTCVGVLHTEKIDQLHAEDEHSLDEDELLDEALIVNTFGPGAIKRIPDEDNFDSVKEVKPTPPSSTKPLNFNLKKKLDPSSIGIRIIKKPQT